MMIDIILKYCVHWLDGWLVGPNQMQIVQFNAVFAAVLFCCYILFFFAASFNTQIHEWYKCEHHEFTVSRMVAGQQETEERTGGEKKIQIYEKRFDSEFIADLDKC